MSGHAARFALASGLVSLAVLLLGRSLAGSAGHAGVAVGVAVACASQVGAFWLLACVLFPNQRMVAFGLGMLARMGVVAASALLLVPLAGLPAAATLLSLVSVLFVTSVLEPVLFAVQPRLEG
ncbi:hypothetical protein BH24GEM2_BH24GEM2_07890 [soil metagenome]|nr:hypothetical protein [Gemmatimonadota bacterium]